MHESIAKAKVKGIFRQAGKHHDALDKYADQQLARGECLEGRKQIERFVEYFLKGNKAVEIGYWRNKKSSSWHQTHVQMHFCPKTFDFDELGMLYPIFINILDTRGLNKGNDNGFRTLYSRVCVHDHFMIRLMQRVDKKDSDALIKSIAYLVFGLSLVLGNNIETYLVGGDGENTVDDKFVFKLLAASGYVLVVTFHRRDFVFVLNTVLMEERFTDNQRKLYQGLFDDMRESKKQSCIYCELTDKLIDISELESTFSRSNDLLRLSQGLFDDRD
ncbi:hypothetical protein [Alteromonas flava]|uniref:hypothetical protein n=1 Tax=Alteromonas flava TaxID=2048003 RepID=UPI000F5EFB7A|nr:hypothetical protein [Alteromonas flava]